MKKFLTLLFLLVSLSAFPYSPAPTLYYLQEDGRWYFGIRTRDGAVWGTEIIGADAWSFRVVYRGCYRGCIRTSRRPTQFARDINYVYYSGQRIEDANPRTWQLIESEAVWRDLLYSRDDKSVFFRDKKIEGADRGTFEDISIRAPSTFGRDKNSIFRGAVRTSYDVATFRELRWRGFTADKSGVYYQDTLLEGSCFNDFREVLTPLNSSSPYIISNNRVFFKNHELKGADAESFQVLVFKDGWTRIYYTVARDKNHVFINNQRLAEIDAETAVTSVVGRAICDVMISDKNGTFRIRRDWETGVFSLIPIETE